MLVSAQKSETLLVITIAPCANAGTTITRSVPDADQAAAANAVLSIVCPHPIVFDSLHTQNYALHPIFINNINKLSIRG